MASGTLTGEGWGVYAVVKWSSTKGTGGSTVNASLIAQNPSAWYWSATVSKGYTLTINGTAKTGNTSKLSSTKGGSSTLISNSVWVAYTGNKSITISGTMDCSNIIRQSTGEAIGVRSVSGTATLDKVGEKPPVPTVSAPTTSTISETATSITIKWAKSSDYSGAATYTLQVSKNGGTYSTIKSSIANGTVSYSYTITAGQGNTYVFRVCAVNDVGTSDYSYSGTVTTNSISAPTVGDIATYNPYVGNLTVTVSGGSQTNGGSFNRNCHIYYDWGGSSQFGIGTCASVANTSTSLTMTTSSTIQSNVLSALGSSVSSGNFYAVCWNENSNGSRSTLVTKKFTININTDGGATPTITASTIGGGALGYASTCFIAGVSELKVTVGSVSLRRGASSYNWKIDVTGYDSATTSPKTYSNLTSGVKTIKVTVTDNRGLTGSTSTQIRVQTYALPTIRNAKGARLSDPNTSATVTYEPYYTPIYAYSAGVNTAGTQLNGINSQQYSVDGSTWASYTSGTTITGLSTGSTHTIGLRVADKVKTSSYTETSVLIPTIVIPLAFRKSGIGINCIPQSGYALDISGAVRIINGDKNIVVNNGVIDAIGTDDTNARYGNGFIELSYSTPYIDFHYGNSTSDYTSRLIANGENKLTCTSRFDAASFNGVCMSGINFATNTTVSLPLAGSDRGVAIVSIALNGGTLYVYDLVYYNSKSTITKIISLGTASVDKYSIQDSNLVITCNTNWSRGLVVYC